MPRIYNIKLRQGTGANVVPTAANFDIGEPAWNSTNGILYIKNSANQMVPIGSIVPSLNGGPLAGNRNVIINGAMSIDQRNNGSTQTFTAGSALAYCVDRWYTYSTGANITGNQFFTSQDGSYRYILNGSTGVTGIGFGQRIEQLNSFHLAGSTATLSIDIANNFLSTITWTLFKANTTDTFGTLASPTRTQIATGTWTVNNVVNRYSTQISIPSDANTGLEVVFTVGAQTSGSLIVGNVQLEAGSISTPFERRSHGIELMLCQRYYWRGTPATDLNFPSYTAGVVMSWPIMFPVQMRVTPTLISNFSGVVYSSAQNLNWAQPTRNGGRLLLFSTAQTGNATLTFSSNDFIAATAEL